MVVYSQHPYCGVNNIVLSIFLKQPKFDVLICSLNLFIHMEQRKLMNDEEKF